MMVVGGAAGGGEENAADGLEPVLGLQLPGNHPLGVSADVDKLEVVHLRQFNKIDEGICVHCDPGPGSKRRKGRDAIAFRVPDAMA